MKRLRCLVLGGAILGCTPEYAYVPTTNATVIQSHSAAHYAIPASAPRGDLELEPLGVASLQGVRALHVRAILMNNDSRAWTFDTREQRLDLMGYGPIGATSASSSVGSSSVVTVPTGSKVVVDLYFPLPAAASHEQKLPTFDLVWNVRTSEGDTSRRTQFDRVTLLPPPDVYNDGPGTPYYYGAPFYPFR
jgi:hypothetical protein